MDNICAECSRVFDSQDSLKNHFMAKHGNGAPREKEGGKDSGEDAFTLVAGVLGALALASAWIAWGIQGK